VFANCTFKTSD